MKIYIGFSSPISKTAIFADVIKLVEKRSYDHCYIRLQDPNGQWLIFQASGMAVNLFNVDVFKSINTSIKEYEIEITPEQSQALWTFATANLGIPYSLLEDFGILLMKIFKLLTNPYNKGMSAEFCSELAAKVCNLLNITLPTDAVNIDPSGLDTILSNVSPSLVLLTY